MMSSGDDISYIVSGSGNNHIGATNPVFGRAGRYLHDYYRDGFSISELIDLFKIVHFKTLTQMERDASA